MKSQLLERKKKTREGAEVPWVLHALLRPAIILEAGMIVEIGEAN